MQIASSFSLAYTFCPTLRAQLLVKNPSSTVTGHLAPHSSPVLSHPPGRLFLSLCRTYADLEDEVEVETTVCLECGFGCRDRRRTLQRNVDASLHAAQCHLSIPPQSPELPLNNLPISAAECQEGGEGFRDECQRMTPGNTAKLPLPKDLEVISCAYIYFPDIDHSM